VHLFIGSRVVIKLFHDAHANAIAQFSNEVRNAGAVHSPNVVRIFDAGRLSDGRPFVVMEYVDGETLDRVIARGPLALSTVREIARQVLAALSCIHASEIVHRDVKPSNIIVLDDRSDGLAVRLIDFGISELVDPGRRGLSVMISGTPHYMAPDQVLGRPQTPRVDLFAMGVVLYEMVTGRLPFVGQNPAEIAGAVLCAAPTPPHDLRPDCPPALGEAILCALGRSNREGFADAASMSAAIVSSCVSRAQGPRLVVEDDEEVKLPMRSVAIPLLVALVVAALLAGWAYVPSAAVTTPPETAPSSER
jgi:serine/threonine-protein kinase